MAELRKKARQYLGRYRDIHAALECTEIRHKRIHREFADSANICSVERDLAEQRNACSTQLSAIQKWINLFPITSRKHLILTMRYIDNFSWTQIEARLYLSESACRKVEMKAIDELLKNKTFRSDIEKI